ncbi:MarR family winged helix-turn-helix transcriptional regulator [Allostreptomyces psammosilenae]|uniref:DNA-binding MarR family transcriptional regulator n=1 Tax=Allostreptomyces psammosilenae TaxID=1892865 RepID=A0A852ZXC2_9ACTN|nr:MarR family transcriptional regulator [Allostreptomyces psammosilenae]NYI06849.1 DNA-binding MarR family transcriptional regulator [Allostreptomyces psammosilenae]
MHEDAVARAVRQWRQVHPDLDVSPITVVGRINRCAALLQQAADTPLGRYGITRHEFDVLCTLRRVGHELTAGQLARETFSSGAAVTKRLRILEERELVERRADPRDKRTAHLRLTAAGQELVDAVLPEQLAYEKGLLAGIAEDRREALADTLGELLLLLEGRLGGLPG